MSSHQSGTPKSRVLGTRQAWFKYFSTLLVPLITPTLVIAADPIVTGAQPKVHEQEASTATSQDEKHSAAAMALGDFVTRDAFIRYGVISDEAKLSAFPGPKLIAVGTRRDFNWATWQVEVGGIFDGRTGSKSGAFGTFSVGLETKTRPFYIYYLPGVALVTSPDDYLTTFYQFSHDIGGGIRDARGVSIDFTYRHFSNASIHLPNPGRNYLVLKLGIPWNWVF